MGTSLLFKLVEKLLIFLLGGSVSNIKYLHLRGGFFIVMHHTLEVDFLKFEFEFRRNEEKLILR